MATGLDEMSIKNEAVEKSVSESCQFLSNTLLAISGKLDGEVADVRKKVTSYKGILQAQTSMITRQTDTIDELSKKVATMEKQRMGDDESAALNKKIETKLQDLKKEVDRMIKTAFENLKSDFRFEGIDNGTEVHTAEFIEPPYHLIQKYNILVIADVDVGNMDESQISDVMREKAMQGNIAIKYKTKKQTEYKQEIVMDQAESFDLLKPTVQGTTQIERDAEKESDFEDISWQLIKINGVDLSLMSPEDVEAQFQTADYPIELKCFVGTCGTLTTSDARELTSLLDSVEIVKIDSKPIDMTTIDQAFIDALSWPVVVDWEAVGSEMVYVSIPEAPLWKFKATELAPIVYKSNTPGLKNGVEVTSINDVPLSVTKSHADVQPEESKSGWSDTVKAFLDKKDDIRLIGIKEYESTKDLKSDISSSCRSNVMTPLTSRRGQHARLPKRRGTGDNEIAAMVKKQVEKKAEDIISRCEFMLDKVESEIRKQITDGEAKVTKELGGIYEDIARSSGMTEDEKDMIENLRHDQQNLKDNLTEDVKTLTDQAAVQLDRLDDHDSVLKTKFNTVDFVIRFNELFGEAIGKIEHAINELEKDQVGQRTINEENDLKLVYLENCFQQHENRFEILVNKIHSLRKSVKKCQEAIEDNVSHNPFLANDDLFCLSCGVNMPQTFQALPIRRPKSTMGPGMGIGGGFKFQKTAKNRLATPEKLMELGKKSMTMSKSMPNIDYNDENGENQQLNKMDTYLRDIRLKVENI